MIDAALQSANVPLDVNETCRGVGTEATDATLGRYLSGFMAGLDPEAGQNGIVTSVEEVPTGWVCRFLVQRRAGEEVWRWGLEFEFGKDGMLKASSYRCIGAG